MLIAQQLRSCLSGTPLLQCHIPTTPVKQRPKAIGGAANGPNR